MLTLENIQKNAAIAGIEPGQVVRIVTTEPVGDNALTVYYKTADGQLHERMLFRADEATLSLAEVGRLWAFDVPGADFKLAGMAGLLTRELLMRPYVDCRTNPQPMAGFETIREQGGDVTAPTNIGERK